MRDAVCSPSYADRDLRLLLVAKLSVSNCISVRQVINSMQLFQHRIQWCRSILPHSADYPSGVHFPCKERFAGNSGELKNEDVQEDAVSARACRGNPIGTIGAVVRRATELE